MPHIPPHTVSATLVRHARTAAGLSRRALAARVGVAASTISRVERQQMEPTVAMLQRLLAGADVALELTPAALGPAPSLAQLAADLSDEADVLERVAAVVAWAVANPLRVGSVIADPPANLSPQLDAFLAGVGAMLAAEYHLEQPEWYGDVEWLDDDWSPAGASVSGEPAREFTPEPLAWLGVLIPAGDLWPDPS